MTTAYYQLFPLPHSELLIISLLLTITSIFLSNGNKDKAAIFCLFIAALVLRIFMAHVDPFLNNWDERFHALAARNMMDTPLKPMIHAHPLLPYDYTIWCCNHVWLHKPPLSLWQMAFSMKVFGVSEFAIRYPGILMGSLMVLLIYRIADIVTANKKIAFIAALLMCFSLYSLQFISGYMGMDQNDICFDFYVLASIWAYVEYRVKPKLGWVILIGVLAGCAVLTKWLVGILVFSGWGVNILLSLKNKQVIKDVLYFILALVVCIVVFMPWQLYIWHTYPAEAKYEYEYASRHVWEVMESFAGDGWFYWDWFNMYFGKVIWVLVLAGLPMLLLMKKYRRPVTIAVVTCFLSAFVFFSFIAKTKINAYFMVVVPLGYIFMAVVTYHLLNLRWFTQKNELSVNKQLVLYFNNSLKGVSRYFYVPALILLAVILFNLPTITEIHDQRNLGKNGNFCQYQAHNNEIYKNLRHYMPGNVKVVFNMITFNEVDVMFYNKNVEAYAWCPPKDMFNKYIKANNVPIAVFKAHNEYGVPNYIKNYPFTYIIDKEIK